MSLSRITNSLYIVRKIHFLPCSGFAAITARFLSAERSNQVEGTIPHGGHGMAVSQFAQVRRIFTTEDVATFGKLVSDNNPLHRHWKIDSLPPELQEHPLVEHIKNEDRDETKTIVHGMLASSLFSCIFGTLVPGSVYLNQTLDFRKPVYADELAVGRVEVIRLREWGKIGGVIVTCDTKVTCGDRECVLGKANVWLPGGSKTRVKSK